MSKEIYQTTDIMHGTKLLGWSGGKIVRVELGYYHGCGS